MKHIAIASIYLRMGAILSVAIFQAERRISGAVKSVGAAVAPLTQL